MPWETGATEGKYRYHPGGDGSTEPKDAPSAINVVVIPDVNLPKVRNTQLHPRPPVSPLASRKLCKGALVFKAVVVCLALPAQFIIYSSRSPNEPVTH